MRHVSLGLEELTTRAYDLVSAGELVRARAVLEDGLADARSEDDDVPPELVEAASLYARVLLASGESEAARDWAAYAHRAAEHLHGPDDQRTVRDQATLAAALYRAGDLPAAEQLYRVVVDRLSAQDGPGSPQTLAARADLATVLHATGQCRAARSELAAALAAHQAGYGLHEPAGIRMLARLAAMNRDCDDEAAAERHFARAAALAQTYLPPDHPVAAQIAALRAAPANRTHPCQHAPDGPTEGDPDWWPPEDGPGGPHGIWDPPAGRPPVARTAQTATTPDDSTPTTTTPDRSSPTQATPDRSSGEADRTGRSHLLAGDARPIRDRIVPRDRAMSSASDPLPAAGPESDPVSALSHPPHHRPATEGGGRGGRAATIRPVSTRGHTAAPRRIPTARRMPLLDPGADADDAAPDLASGRQPHPPGTGDGPPPAGAAHPAAPGAAPGPASPPAVRRPADGVAEVPDTGRTAAALPARLNNALDRLRQPYPGRHSLTAAQRPIWSTVALGGTLAVLGVAGGWLAATAALNGDDTEPQRTVEAGPGGAGSRGGPPSGLMLRDDRAGVTLTWTYPADADGPVLVSGGPAGEPARAMDTLAPGATSYTVRGLPERADYCFTVAVVHETQAVAQSAPICTSRGAPPPAGAGAGTGTPPASPSAGG